VSKRGNLQLSRPEQPRLFEAPADDHPPTPPAAPPVVYGRPRLRTAIRDQVVFRAAALDEIIPPDRPARLRVRGQLKSKAIVLWHALTQNMMRAVILPVAANARAAAALMG
jgi:hypothetical protein